MAGRNLVVLLLLLLRLQVTVATQGHVAGVKERVYQVIELLEKSENGQRQQTQQHAIEILYSIVREDEKYEKSISDANNSNIPRRLEDGRDTNDDDDYFSFSSLYSYRRNSDVSVSYDEADNTIVTVGDDVIVVVEHSLYHYVFNGLMVISCVLVGATMAGLLMGVMSLDPLILGVKARTAETEAERRRAVSLLPFVQNKNLVLVSLVLVNCLTNEALPIFLDRLLENPLLTVFLSLTVVVVVGEILPSAYFTGRDQIKSASELIPVLRFVIVVTSPISYPLAKLMDHYFSHGSEIASFKRGEITAIVRIQYEEHLAWKRRQAEKLQKQESMRDDISFASLTSFSKPCDTCNNCNMCEPLAFMNESDFLACMPHDHCLPSTESKHQDLSSDDIIKLEGALSMKDKKVEKVYTPMNRVVSLTADTVLDEEMVVRIYSYGYSRVPVFGRDEHTGALGVCGVLLTKQLMLVRKEDKRQVAQLTLYEPPCVSPNTSLAETLSIILAGNRKSSNMALVCSNPDRASAALRRSQPVPVDAGVLGVITLENVLEELIQEQIYDEKDKKMNPKLKRAKWAVGKWKAFAQRKRMEREDANSTSSEETDANPFDYIKMNEVV